MLLLIFFFERILNSINKSDNIKQINISPNNAEYHSIWLNFPKCAKPQKKLLDRIYYITVCIQKGTYFHCVKIWNDDYKIKNTRKCFNAQKTKWKCPTQKTAFSIERKYVRQGKRIYFCHLHIVHIAAKVTFKTERERKKTIQIKLKQHSILCHSTIVARIWKNNLFFDIPDFEQAKLFKLFKLPDPAYIL